MDEVASTRRSPKPIFTFAAWFSLLGPLLAAGWFYYAASASEPGSGTVRDSKAVLLVLALVFAAGFAAGCASLWGVRANGALVILPCAGVRAEPAVADVTMKVNPRLRDDERFSG